MYSFVNSGCLFGDPITSELAARRAGKALRYHGPVRILRKTGGFSTRMAYESPDSAHVWSHEPQPQRVSLRVGLHDL